MMPIGKLGVVLLAAGRSKRFGENKLLVGFCDRPIVCCAFDAAKQLDAAKTVVVTASDEVAWLAQAYGYEIVFNREPYLGQAHSICLGVQAMAQMDALLLMVCDQPRLTGASLVKLAEGFAHSGKGVACLADETHRGNPAVFSSRYFPKLLALTGDCGAKRILRANEEDLLVVETAAPGELADADTPQALENLLKSFLPTA